jgi:hypothetical protein
MGEKTSRGRLMVFETIPLDTSNVSRHIDHCTSLWVLEFVNSALSSGTASGMEPSSVSSSSDLISIRRWSHAAASPIEVPFSNSRSGGKNGDGARAAPAADASRAQASSDARTNPLIAH